MTKLTQVHTHGPCERYLRTVIPVGVSDALEIVKGNALSWEISDDGSAVLRVVGR